MIRLRKLLGGAGILVLATCGAWALFTGPSDPSSVPWLVAAGIGLLLWLQALALGDMERPRRFLGALGLVTVAISLPIMLIAFAVDRTVVPPLFAATAFGLVLWGGQIGHQAHLPARVTVAWLVVLVLLGAAFIALAAAGALAVSLALGTAGERTGSPVTADPVAAEAVESLVVGLVLAAGAAVAARHPGRMAVLRALGRAGFARATPADTALLSAGPRALLRAG
jgi:hypothetical protein